MCGTSVSGNTWLEYVCLPRATIKLIRSALQAQSRQNGCLGRSKAVHSMFRHRHGCRGCHKVMNVLKTLTQGLLRRLVAERSLK